LNDRVSGLFSSSWHVHSYLLSRGSTAYAKGDASSDARSDAATDAGADARLDAGSDAAAWTLSISPDEYVLFHAETG
jgi:hypothetical protein